jgi:YD repeat-containing protein
MTDYQPSVPGERMIFWFTYDQAGRLWKVHSNRIDNFSLAKLDAEYNYTADGLVSQLALGGSTTVGGAQLVDYKYNIRGWLTSINDTTLSSQSGFATDRFAMHLAYDSFLQSNGNFEAQYNGNISQVRWKLHPSIIDVDDDPAYTYNYDNAGRLTLADFTNTSVGADPWDVRNITYDKNGNFTTLTRYSQSDSLALNYDYYTNTNRLKWIGGSTNQYSYDQLGNQKSNSTSGRKILSTAYDGRNLPIRMIQTKHSDSGVAQLHRYGYDAAGNRVRKRFLAGSTLWGETGFDYIRGADGAVIAVYNQSGTLLYWNLPGGLGQIIK